MRLPPDERLRADVGQLLQKAGELAPGVVDAIATHLRLLASWNDAYGLTRITEWPDVLDRHVGESLLPLKYIPRLSGRLLDIGSGNGFPVFPILTCRPELSGVLIERSERKTLFLDAVVGDLRWASRVSIVTADVERFSAADDRDCFDHVISRATLAPDALLPLAARLVKPGGRVFLYASESVDAGSEQNVDLGFEVESRETEVDSACDPSRVSNIRGPAYQDSEQVGGEAARSHRRAQGSLGSSRAPVTLNRLAREPIMGRRDSYLHVLEAVSARE